MKKTLYTLVLILCLTAMVAAQLTLQTQVDNSKPLFTTLQTYSRYSNSTDNFPTQNFTICIGETNRTIFTRLVAQDKNSNQEITNGGNVTWKIVSLINGEENNISAFGNNSKEPTLNETLSSTSLAYLDNLTLTNNGTLILYRVIANVTDSNNDYTTNMTTFSLYQSDGCVRTQEEATVLTTQPYSLTSNYSTISIVVDENVTGTIIITLHDDSPVDNGHSQDLGKYITVDVQGSILQQTINFSLIVNYTDEELEQKSLTEDNLTMYSWDTEEATWNLEEATVNTEQNTITLLINETTLNEQSYRLGTYSIRASSTSSGSEENSNSGGGGGGSGSSSSGGGGNIPLTGEVIGDNTGIEFPFLPIPRDRDGDGDSDGLTEEIVTTTIGAFNTLTKFLTQIGKELRGEEPITPQEKPLCCFILFMILILVLIIGTIIILEKNKRIRILEKQLREKQLAYPRIGKDNEYFIK